MKLLSKLILVLVVAGLFMTDACKKETPVVKIGLVGGLGGFHDRGFNQDILEGFQKAEEDLGFQSEVLECQKAEDFATNIGILLEEDFDLIVTTGFDASQATLAAAYDNPETDFIILDFSVDNPPSNLKCVIFQVDQSSFPCGFLAAWWTDREDNENPLAGFVAGPAIPEIMQFSVSYEKGIEYYNTQYKREVASAGYYASSFADTLMGAQLADSLIQQGAKIIFAFAGKTGNGALYKTKEAGIHAIGVDVDQYISIPAVGPVLLTSCMKMLERMTYTVLEDYMGRFYNGGEVLKGNLSNGGVGMAPFHEFDLVIPDSIKEELAAIERGIKLGTVDTGWN
jgi:basic membrane protein A